MEVNIMAHGAGRHGSEHRKTERTKRRLKSKRQKPNNNQR